MPVHVEDMSSEVSVVDADLPLSDAQIDKLVGVVMRRLERKQREAKQSDEATVIRPHSVSFGKE